ncbi:MAG TPA: hypothetical protein VK943_16565, partial [Arenibaculum sp.]|nr:hypothetical protein [Arenibaculum sp.]
MPSESALCILRRHDPSAHQLCLAYRPKEELPFDPEAAPPLPLLLDTTVYIDRLLEKVPEAITLLVATRPVLHSAVACSELTISLGILDPQHADTA